MIANAFLALTFLGFLVGAGRFAMGYGSTAVVATLICLVGAAVCLSGAVVAEAIRKLTKAAGGTKLGPQ